MRGTLARKTAELDEMRGTLDEMRGSYGRRGQIWMSASGGSVGKRCGAAQ